MEKIIRILPFWTQIYKFLINYKSYLALIYDRNSLLYCVLVHRTVTTVAFENWAKAFTSSKSPMRHLRIDSV